MTPSEIISTARLQDPEIGDDAIIAFGEWGYWVGSIYVSKTDVSNWKWIADHLSKEGKMTPSEKFMLAAGRDARNWEGTPGTPEVGSNPTASTNN